MTELPDLTGSGDCLVVREGDRIVAASAEDQAVVRAYQGADEKGPVVDGYRLTLLASKKAARPGEPVRVFHVCESTARDRPLYVMGPKPVVGEYVDNRLVTDAPPGAENPVAPASYDGRVADGPGIDANYDVTEYRFETRGIHTIQWRLGPHVSNVLAVEVSAGEGRG